MVLSYNVLQLGKNIVLGIDSGGEVCIFGSIDIFMVEVDCLIALTLLTL